MARPTRELPIWYGISERFSFAFLQKIPQTHWHALAVLIHGFGFFVSMPDELRRETIFEDLIFNEAHFGFLDGKKRQWDPMLVSLVSNVKEDPVDGLLVEICEL